MACARFVVDPAAAEANRNLRDKDIISVRSCQRPAEKYHSPHLDFISRFPAVRGEIRLGTKTTQLSGRDGLMKSLVNGRNHQPGFV